MSGWKKLVKTPKIYKENFSKLIIKTQICFISVNQNASAYQVPAWEVDHEKVERFADPFSGHQNDWKDVDQDTDDGCRYTQRTV